MTEEGKCLRDNIKFLAEKLCEIKSENELIRIWKFLRDEYYNK